MVICFETHNLFDQFFMTTKKKNKKQKTKTKTNKQTNKEQKKTQQINNYSVRD